MKNIHDLMQQHYENDDPKRRFQFREEYWEQALALIEADEARRRKKRKRFIWWSISSMLLAGVLAMWHFQDEGARSSKNENGKGYATEVVQNEPPDNRQSDAAAAQAGAAFAQNADKNNTPIQALTNQHPDIPSNQQAGTRQLPTSPANETSQKGNHAAAITPHMIPPGNTRLHPHIGADTALSASINLKKNNTASDPNAAQTSVEQPSMASRTALTDQPEVIVDHIPYMAQIVALPLPLGAVYCSETPRQPKLVSTPAAPDQQIKPVSDKRFSFGASAAAVASKPSLDDKWLGYSAHVFSTYQWQKSWSVSLGLGARYQAGVWRDSFGGEFGERYLYSFGFESKTAERLPTGLLFLEAPVSVSWKYRVIALTAGVAPGRILYALDRYKELSANSFRSQHTVKNRIERGDTTPFTKYYAQAFGGISWQFSRHLSVTLRGNYRFGALMKATAEEPAVKSAPSLELGLKFTLR